MQMGTWWEVAGDRTCEVMAENSESIEALTAPEKEALKAESLSIGPSTPISIAEPPPAKLSSPSTRRPPMSDLMSAST